MHLLEYDRVTSSNYIKDLGEIEFDEKGILKTTLKTDDLKLELEKLGSIGSWNSKEGDNYEIFFVIESKETGIKFLDVEEKTRAKIKSIYPNVQSKATNKEKANFLFIDAEKDIVDVRFLDGNGNRLWKILEFGQPAKVHIQTRNMKKTKIKRQVFLNKAKGDDVEVDNGAEYTIPDNELLILDINTNILKNKVPERERKTVSMFYYVFKESDGDVFRYPKDLEISQKLDISKPNFYHHLKLMESPQLMNSLAATNAPLIVGEPLEMEQSHNSVGECCIIDVELFLSNYESEFPTKNNKGQIIPLPEKVKSSLRRMFKSISEYYSNEKKCCNKYQIAYLLATSKHETGHTFDPVEEAHWLSWKVRKKYFEDMYDPVLGKSEKRRSMSKNNGNTQQGDGVKFYGRGYVQLTWKDNYQRMKDKFQVDFVNERQKALEHEWAMKILLYGSEQGVFTGLKLGRYVSNTKKDYYHARQVINGLDKASTIEGYAKKIEKCIKIKECKCGSISQNSNSQKKAGYDIEKAVEKLNKQVLSSSSGYCARYVRWAIEAGGLSTHGRPVSAKDYDKYLPTLGFSEISKENYSPQKGDIVVIESINGHPDGHIAMYNGSQWLSDFKQKDIWAGSAFRNVKPNYRIFRWQ